MDQQTMHRGLACKASRQASANTDSRPSLPQKQSVRTGATYAMMTTATIKNFGCLRRPSGKSTRLTPIQHRQPPRLRQAAALRELLGAGVAASGKKTPGQASPWSKQRSFGLQFAFLCFRIRSCRAPWSPLQTSDSRAAALPLLLGRVIHAQPSRRLHGKVS